MKRYMLLLLLMFSVHSYSQSVLGIGFGSDYKTVKSMLESRYGKYEVHEDEGCLKLYNFTMGDFFFKFGTFYFQWNGDNTYFNAAEFSLPSDDNNVETMKSSRDYLYSLLKEKYENEYLEQFINDEGFKCYKFGINPIDSTQVLGNIILHRSKSNDGKTRLYLDLNYLPIHYVSKSSDF